MNWKNRLRRIKALGQDLGIKYDIGKALELNSLSLANVGVIRAMMGMEGWQILSDRMRADIRNKRDAIVDLSCNPIENRDKLIINYAIQETLNRILSFANGAVNKEPHLLAERERLTSKREA